MLDTSLNQQRLVHPRSCSNLTGLQKCSHLWELLGAHKSEQLIYEELEKKSHLLTGNEEQQKVTMGVKEVPYLSNVEEEEQFIRWKHGISRTYFPPTASQPCQSLYIAYEPQKTVQPHPSTLLTHIIYPLQPL